MHVCLHKKETSVYLGGEEQKSESKGDESVTAWMQVHHQEGDLPTECKLLTVQSYFTYVCASVVKRHRFIVVIFFSNFRQMSS